MDLGNLIPPSITLIKLLQSWQSELDKSGFVATVLMDLSKAYYCLSFTFSIAKLEDCGVSKEKLFECYLENRAQ